MKKTQLTIMTLLASSLLTAQTQLNTLTDFSDFSISTSTTNPIVQTSTSPERITGTSCASGIFQKLYVAGQVYDSIVATYQIKTNASSTITNYGQPVAVGISNIRTMMPNYSQINVGASLQFCGTHDTILFANLLVMAYGAHSLGISEIQNEINRNIYTYNKTIFLNNFNLENLFISIYDYTSRRVYFDKVLEKKNLI